MNARRALVRFGGKLRRRNIESIFYLHVPKCGGTSLRRAMSDAYRTTGRSGESGIVHIRAAPKMEAAGLLGALGSPMEVERLDEFVLLYYMCHAKTRFIDGHIPFPHTAYRHFGERFRFVSLLRDPVDRWISEYSYNRFHGSDHMRHTADLPVAEYLESEFALGQGGQYVLHLGGRRADADYRSPEAIDAALANIEKFELIGCVERMQEFADAFAARFGWRLSMPKLNVSPSPVGFVAENFSADVRERIREVCAPDYRIYEAVLERTAAR